MSDALVGYTGFVGSILLKQRGFGQNFSSANINDIGGRRFDLLVCAAAPAQKWIANREPDVDRQKIEGLIAHLKTVQCKTFVLISTVDVFKSPIGVNEDTPVAEADLHPYGLHRRMLEQFVEAHFAHHLIVRLPGLVGPGLRKNLIFDFLNGNNLHAIDSRGVFQFYPMVNLWFDIQTALEADLKLVHLTAEPLSVAELSATGFGKTFDQTLANSPARYDLQSRYAHVFGGQGGYQYSKRETIQAVRSYAQSEPISIKAEGGKV
ncbi:pyridine nucleotide transhydrogenase [Rhodoferax aquaticus]|uniref:Pyridine nucleotide transhydrogenase n=1 Tax=Rhodoferax aquaticus TaxID=2527691 RepID=A0A515ERE8_9BURK|nr:pyridine nucleotide transhydrogenase [Rhodoferax aquaticus]QDL55229.1 pyridine nucleotide transhydrogenase [Rhodoferax aquaticus]